MPKLPKRANAPGGQQGSNFTLNTVLQIEGFMPSFTHTQLQQDMGKVYVIRGRNFDWDLQGPKSGYGNECLYPRGIPLEQLKYQPRFFRIQEHTFLFTAGVVYTQFSVCGELTPIFTFEWNVCGGEDEGQYPWSMAYVGQYYLFSHPYAGIIYFDELNQVWGKHPLDAPCITSCVYGITSAKNRLVILTRDTVVYSAYDDPFAIKCNNYDGAGIQSLDEISKGIPYGVYETRQGFVVYTSRGILSGREVPASPFQGADPGNISVGTLALVQPAFNVDWHADQIVPIGPNAIAAVAGFEQIILTKRGFYRVDGMRTLGELADQFAWQTLIGVYFADTEFKDNRSVNLRDYGAVRLEYDWQFGRLWVACRDEKKSPYNRALVYQFDYDRWGSFDITHWCVGATQFSRVEFNKVKSYGFITQAGLICEFRQTAHSCVQGNAHECAATPGICIDKYWPLDSFIEIGPFKRTDYRYANRMSNFTAVTLDMPTTRGGLLDERAHTHRLNDAWEERTQNEVACACKVSLSCSIDGYRLFEHNYEPLTLSDVDGRRRHYACYNTGVVATILIDATQVGEYYQLHTVMLTAHLGGGY